MALRRADAELWFLRVLGILRNPLADHDPRSIALAQYRRELASGPTYSYGEWLSVALQAARANAAGRASQSNPGTVVIPPRNATDPTAVSGATGYQYRVVVEVYEGGQRVGSTAVWVTSETPLSADAAGVEAVDVARGLLPGADYRANVVEGAGSGATFRTFVVSSGRIV